MRKIPHFLQFEKVGYSGVYFGIPAIHSSIQRSLSEFHYWGNNIPFYSKDSVFKIITGSKLKGRFENDSLVCHPPPQANSHNILLFPWYDGMKDFYYNYPNLNWFYRPSDDMQLIHRSFAKLINRLESLKDPRTYPIIKTQDCGMNLHGGVGWLMSRQAVKQVLESWDTVKNDYTTADDVMVRAYLIAANINMSLVNDRAFMGSGVLNLSLILNRSFDQIIDCGKYTIINKLKETACWHIAGNPDIWKFGDEIVRDVPDNISVAVIINGFAGVCYHNYTKEEIDKRNNADYMI